MNADPEQERAERLRKARRSLKRTAAFWTPLATAALGFGLYFFFDELLGDGSGWAIPAVFLVFSVLFGFQGVQAIRDLVGGTVMLTGSITRHWWRLDFVISRSHYVRIDNDKILRADRVQHLLVKQGDYVGIEYFPASMLAASIEKIDRPEGEEEPPDEPPGPTPAESNPLLIERE